ncbi:NADPH-dependent FMN reductase [Microlunatus sp. GCM10028923]|uniref:NADPH-dependent FMN reductase n=1 Tax=Microlunatus sp. GCM10028923 TaxID=3273400 RepID=UPI003610D954
MALRVTIVVGNPKPQSRTRRIAETLVDQLVPSVPDLEVIDLADHVDEIFAWPSEKFATLNARVADSDLVVFATPTYKASYTGLLKAFLDRYPANGLQGVVAIPVFTGADATHSMGPNVNLAPLLVELGALLPGKGLYFIVSQMDQVDEIVAAAAADYRRAFAALRTVADAVTAPALVETGAEG